MPQPVSLSFAMGLPPKDAVAYFESKGYAVPGDWKEMDAAARARAFTVANCAKLDVQKDIREAVLTALKDGKTDDWFRKHLEPKLKEKGWWGKAALVDQRTGEERQVQLGSPARLRLIYRQNMQEAFMAGRYKQMMENADARPFWQYVAILDGKTRPAHKILNGRTFRYDDPFWSSHYPPNGFNCRCRARALSDVRMEAENVTPESGAGNMVTHEHVTLDRATGQEVRRKVTGYKVPETGYVAFTDVGFSQNPAAAAYQQEMGLARRLAQVPDPAVRLAAVLAANANPARAGSFEAWARKVLESGRGSRADVRVVHYMRNEVARAIRERGGAPVQVAVVSSTRLLHANSEKHVKMGTAPGTDALAALPEMMDSAEQVLWDHANSNVVYVVPLEDGKSLKIVLDAPARGKDAKKMAGRYDAVINAMRVDDMRLDPAVQKQYEVIWEKK